MSGVLELATASFLCALLVGGANAPKNLGFYLGALVFALRLLYSPRAVVRDTFASRLTLPLIGLFAAGVWGTLMSDSAAASWASFYRYDNLGMAILFALMISHERWDAARIKRVLGCALLVLAGTNVWQLAYMARYPVFLEPTAYSYNILWTTREFGERLNLLVPFVWLIPVLFGVRWRSLSGAWTVLIVALLVPTGYRGAWLGFALAAALWIVSRRRWKLVALGVAAVAALAAALPLLPTDSMVSRAVHRGVYERFRPKYVWLPTLEIVSERPIAGYGFGDDLFMRAYEGARHGRADWILVKLTDPHNNALAMQFAAGLPGTLAYTILVLACLLAAAKPARSAPDERRRQTNLAILASWVATFVSLGQTDMVSWNYFGFLAVLGVIAHREQDDASGAEARKVIRAPRRVLFFIRDKLGDSLLAFATVQRYVGQRPDDAVTVLMRKDYADLVKAERGFRLVSYRSGAQALLWALRLRLSSTPFDALVVLRGFGKRVRRLGQLIPARRRISFSDRLAPTFNEWPTSWTSDDGPLIDASYRAAAVLEPGLPMPDKLDLPTLRPAVGRTQKRFVGVCPITDEKRKNLSQSSLAYLLEFIEDACPGAPIKVMVREGAERVFDLRERPGCDLVNFGSLVRLRELFGDMAAYYGADTGLYHLAAAMGIPATVVFGPTQPGRIILPRQDAASVRLEVLAERHCDVKACRNPLCIEQACANLTQRPIVVSVDAAPAECPLRAHSVAELTANRWHHYPCGDATATTPRSVS